MLEKQKKCKKSLLDGISYTQFTDDIFSEENVPEKGQCVPILYNKDDSKDYAVAKHDWMTKSDHPALLSVGTK